ncbi:MAG: DUF305 domain-containing protein [Proteobacteria bacterium]|nr:MAG: DUF305 domain-containing protein [Pseudomonadota bacterium]
MNRPLYLRRLATFAVAALIGASALGQAMAHHHGQSPAAKPPVFIASTAKPFAALMDDAMAVMDEGMKRAPMNGVSEHDFVTMMIPHHQGAVDMAKALLLYTKDPELRNVAQGIITEQQNEIKVMQAWLQRYQTAQSKVFPSSINKKE